MPPLFPYPTVLEFLGLLIHKKYHPENFYESIYCLNYTGLKRIRAKILRTQEPFLHVPEHDKLDLRVKSREWVYIFRELRTTYLFSFDTGLFHYGQLSTPTNKCNIISLSNYLRTRILKFLFSDIKYDKRPKKQEP